MSLISSIRGKLESVGPGWADILVGGVVFRVRIPATTSDGLPRVGEQARLYTSLQVREDSLNLYGFLTDEARETFETLLGVSGIGPRVALSVLSRFTPDSLAAAVNTGDLKAFRGVPGVGTKTASRLVLELKGKLEGDWTTVSPGSGGNEVVDALAALGYTYTEIREALSALPRDEEIPVEEKVRLALQHMAGQ